MDCCYYPAVRCPRGGPEAHCRGGWHCRRADATCATSGDDHRDDCCFCGVKGDWAMPTPSTTSELTVAATTAAFHEEWTLLGSMIDELGEREAKELCGRLAGVAGALYHLLAERGVDAENLIRRIGVATAVAEAAAPGDAAE